MSYYYNYSYLTKEKESYQTLPINTTTTIFNSSNKSRKCCSLHNHEPIEFNAVIKGTLCITLNKKNYILSSGEVLLANPYDLHEIKWADGCTDGEYLTLILHLPKLLLFGNSPLDKISSELLEGQYIFDRFYPKGSAVFTCIDNINRFYHDKSEANDALCLGQVYTLLGILLKNHYRFNSSTSVKRDSEFLQKIGGYVNKNYMNQIDTHTAANWVHMELSQFCRTFKKHYGESFTNHLCKYRIMQAAEIYKNSQESITVIAKNVGFKDYCYFSRSFKKYVGISPALYFEKWKKSQKGK